MQYSMGFAHAQPGDEIIEREGVKVIVDADSVRFLDGSTVDYSDDLAGAGFRINLTPMPCAVAAVARRLNLPIRRRKPIPETTLRCPRLLCFKHG